VIGITGSVGKTSTRHAIACALKHKFKLREAQRNYNNEKGIPLAVFGADEIDNKIDGIRAIIKGFFCLDNATEVSADVGVGIWY
jgi:hypothetical protein